MRRQCILGAIVASAATLALAPGALAAPRTTVEGTIQDRDGDSRLDPAPGEDYTVIGADGDFRPPRDGSILNFLQLSDFQMVDEESPARVEFLDTTQRTPPAPFSAAYRPQEALTTQITEAMVRQARNTTSPLTSEQLELSILTGDNADSQQYNETRWFIDILDGGHVIDPNSGIPAPGCEATPGSVYDGVRGGGQGIGYYEPDASANHEDGDGYSPDAAENQAETGRPGIVVRDFPGLFERANDPFRSIGLDMPWYSAFGNHDALIQGNSPDAYLGPVGPGGETSNPTYQAIATGCEKPSRLPSEFATDPEAFLARLGSAETPGEALDGTAPFQVPPDPRRCLLAKDEPLGGGAPPPCASGGFVQQHFDTTGTPAGHGFANRPPEAELNNDGYYSFEPRPGLRFIVLDTVTDECGAPICSEGSVDNEQFEWLREEIVAAEDAGQYVMVFSHHTLRTTRFVSTDLTEDPIHHGQRFDRRGGQPQNVSPAETLEELFCEHPVVIAHIAGHEHENYVEGHECERDQPETPGPGEFWHVSTAAHIDWPQQSRMVELIDNGDGTMSLALTILDHDGPPDPGGAPATRPDRGQAGEDVLRLASIGREIAYNDYQGSRGARGAPEDRNVLIVIDRPPPPGD